MPYSKNIALLLALLLLVNPALIYIPNVHIDPILMYQVQVACDRLEASLRQTYGTAYENDINYYVHVYVANYFLQQLSNSVQLKAYSNVVVGSNDTLSGNHNLIIGNNNAVLGNGNYVFSQNFNSAAAGATGNNLVLDEWLVKLAMLNDPITTNFINYMNNPKGSIYRW